MPSVQRGQVYKRKGRSTWSIRHYDEHRVRHERAGFETKSEAAAVLENILDGMRLGPLARRELTIQELVDEYLAQHIAENTRSPRSRRASNTSSMPSASGASTA